MLIAVEMTMFIVGWTAMESLCDWWRGWSHALPESWLDQRFL